jgi:dethiobiotin synthetase
VILVSRNYLGSINHSLLTARVCKAAGLNVAGWIFNDRYLHYEEQIVHWSGYPRIASIPKAETINKAFINTQAALLKETLLQKLC